MSAHEVSTTGSSVTLTGNQVRFIRTVLDESQVKFAERFAISQPAIYRLEKKGDEPQTGPEIILISMLAKQYSIAVPEKPFRRPPEPTSSVAAEESMPDRND